MGKGEIFVTSNFSFSHNVFYEQFLLFPQCFLLNQIIVSPFVYIFDIVSPFVYIFDIISLFAAEEPNIDGSCKRLIQNKILDLSFLKDFIINIVIQMFLSGPTGSERDIVVTIALHYMFEGHFLSS